MQRIGWRWILACLLIGAFSTARADGLSDCAPMLQATGPVLYRGEPPEHQTLCRRGYVLSFNHTRRVPDWVLEELTPARFQGDADRKRTDFHPDPDVPAAQRVAKQDYTNTGFDRGHMAPAADMKWDQEAMAESFLMTNMAPQVGVGLNRHIWAYLEEAVRGWTEERGHVVVITGPIFGDKPKPIVQNNGQDPPVPGQVLIPEAFYKIIYAPGGRFSSSRAIAFIMPNRSLKGREMKEFIVPIREIEARTGLDFLTALSPRTQRMLETTRSSMWRLTK